MVPVATVPAKLPDTLPDGTVTTDSANALTNQQVGMEETDCGVWSRCFHTVRLRTCDEGHYIIQS